MKRELFVMSVMIATRVAFGSPSGLNNIPTADTPGDRVIVLQAYDTFGDKRKNDFSSGMKFGLRPWHEQAWAPRVEGGVDTHLFPDESGPIVFQAKLAIQPNPKLPALAIGSANIALTEDDRDRTGQPFNYAVLSQDFKYFRLHGGYALQAHDHMGFVGVDVTFPVAKRPLTLRSDAIQMGNHSEWVASVGAMYQLNQYIVLEAWGSFPTPEHSEPSVTLKVNWVLDFFSKH